MIDICSPELRDVFTLDPALAHNFSPVLRVGSNNTAQPVLQSISSPDKRVLGEESTNEQTQTNGESCLLQSETDLIPFHSKCTELAKYVAHHMCFGELRFLA
jgi:hypothetical protein